MYLTTNCAGGSNPFNIVKQMGQIVFCDEISSHQFYTVGVDIRTDQTTNTMIIQTNGEPKLVIHSYFGIAFSGNKKKRFFLVFTGHCQQ